MILGFSGFKGAGKDEAASVLVNEFGFTQVALADGVRSLVYAINPIIDGSFGLQYRLQDAVDEHGWDYCKRNIPEIRQLMQRTGTEGGRKLFGENFWIDQLIERVPDIFNPHTRYVITDCRFSNEGGFVQASGGTLIWIDRPGLESDGHASESDELRPTANSIILNDGTKEEYQTKVQEIANFLLADGR